eukprot:CAMPEP_0203891752 /NCGR_PEP_ID=MMETSP0359-20131031/35009_1 /ASSEMBLY_ACC=CAM_ASM_000338 /TAXON_ID=268821 /ORGANISM="Scrippsiella Hangoei, Strain SHTV-5" /LENGTH=194 /DNA_ID=CAMNT_0050813589 /DNA_START=40 /DNA_END=624 /DNA_ORIENTATION=+
MGRKGGDKGGSGGKGRSNSGGKHWRPDPPVDEAGRWVEREEFEGRKSFAFFRCECRKTWKTAHGYPDYTQDCKSCDASCLPTYMWVNDEQRLHPDGDRRQSSDDVGTPHDSARCEACRLGVCSQARDSFTPSSAPPYVPESAQIQRPSDQFAQLARPTRHSEWCESAQIERLSDQFAQLARPTRDSEWCSCTCM